MGSLETKCHGHEEARWYFTNLHTPSLSKALFAQTNIDTEYSIICNYMYMNIINIYIIYIYVLHIHTRSGNQRLKPKSCSKWKGNSNTVYWTASIYIWAESKWFFGMYTTATTVKVHDDRHPPRWAVELWSFLSNRENGVSKCHLLWRWGQFGVPKACAKKCWFSNLPLASVEGQQGL